MILLTIKAKEKFGNMLSRIKPIKEMKEIDFHYALMMQRDGNTKILVITKVVDYHFDSVKV